VLYTLGVLIFAFGLLISIALHEVGHMVPAKKFGVKVTQYMVGFGPTLWSRKRGDTEYGLKAIPLGGYIRMIGMVPPRADGSRSRWPRRVATAVEDFRQVSRAEVRPEDEAREFYRLTPGKKMIVMLGGPSMNLLIYLILTVVIFTTVGKYHQDATTSVGSVTQCVVAANSPDAAKDICPANAQAAPAFGKLQPHDKVLAVNGVAITSWDQLVARIEPSAGQPLNLTIQRDGVTQNVTVTPVKNVKYASDGKTFKTAGYLGIGTEEHRFFKPLGVTGVPREIGSQLRQGVDALGSYPQKIGSLWNTVFNGKPRDINGAVGVVGIGRLGGEFASSHNLDAQQKIFTLVELLATVNLLLFFFNLLPLLPLDGGHVAGALVEATKRGRARLRARRAGDGSTTKTRPQIFVDTAQMLPVMYAVAAVLIVLTLLTLYADIVKPISLNG
jgi:membrane-associated protease RseP (regulator of RpoE activity)